MYCKTSSNTQNIPTSFILVLIRRIEKIKKSAIVTSYEEYDYNTKIADWQNLNDPDDLLVKGFLPDELIELLESRINKVLE